MLFHPSSVSCLSHHLPKIVPINTYTLHPFFLFKQYNSSVTFPISNSPQIEAIYIKYAKRGKQENSVREKKEETNCTMRSTVLFLSLSTLFLLLAAVSSSQAYDFFYFVVQVHI